MKKWFAALAILGSVAGVPARAADHRDGPAALADPSTDITDVYTWMSVDGKKVYLVMNVMGAAMGATPMTNFSNTAVYAFHINSSGKFGSPATGEQLVLCTFSADMAQKVSCWAPTGEYATGLINNTAGNASISGKLKVFAGVRDDPFFFNVRGFRAAAGAVGGAAAGLMFDPAGCPNVSAGLSGMLVGILKSDGAGGPPTDDFSSMGKNTPALNGNILSIVVAIDAAVLTTNGTMLSVWASTNKVK